MHALARRLHELALRLQRWARQRPAEALPLASGGLAPAFVATAGFDPLRDEGEAFARRLEEAGVPVRHQRYDGEIHAFANMVGPPGTARTAMVEVAGALAAALGVPSVGQDPAVA